MLQVSVQGGTGAGRIMGKKQRPKEDWSCPVREGGCGKKNAYFWNKCPNCGHPNPHK